MADYSNLKEALRSLVSDAKLKKVQEEEQRKIQNEKDRLGILSSVGKDLGEVLKPYIEEIKNNSTMSAQQLSQTILDNIKIEVPEVNTDNIRGAIYDAIRQVRIPEPRVSVNVPDVIVPEIKMPEEMNIKGWVSLMGVDLNNPLPVQLRDAKGKAINLFENLTTLVGGGGGGFQVVKVSEVLSSVPITSNSSLIVDQLSGANWSVYITNPVGQGDAATALRVVIAGNSDVSVSATQVGTWTVALSGSLASTVATGPSSVGIVDDGTAPIQISGISRQANPTAVSGGGVVKSSHDDLGRQLIRPVQVRDLIKTAYVSLTTGTETTLLAGVVGAYLDLVYVLATNNSDVAVTVDLRAVTAGNIQTSIRVPANGTAGVALPVPLPQDETGNNWTADLPDITGSTITISALFSQEV